MLKGILHLKHNIHEILLWFGKIIVSIKHTTNTIVMFHGNNDNDNFHQIIAQPV